MLRTPKTSLIIKTYKVAARKRIKDSIGYVDYNKDFDFEYEKSIDIETFLRMKYLSLYSIDYDNKLVAFIEIPNTSDLNQAPLYYQAQYEHAKKIYLLPLEFFLSFNYSPVQDKKCVLIYSVGRCGSTLLSNIFRNISGTCSISEPDVYNQIRLLRRKNLIDEFEARRLINSSTIFFLKSIDMSTTKILVLKFKSEVIKIHHDISNAIPKAKNLFIYRNAIDVIQSYDRIFGYPYTKKRWLFRFPFLSFFYKARKRIYYNRNTALFKQYNPIIKNGSPADIINDLGQCGIYLLEWLLKVYSYNELRKYQSNTIAFRYEDLIQNPEEIIRKILIYCGISADEINDACKTLEIDAHAGTKLAINSKPKYKLDKKDFLGITDAIKRYTEFDGPDLILPGTISIN